MLHLLFYTRHLIVIFLLLFLFGGSAYANEYEDQMRDYAFRGNKKDLVLLFIYYSQEIDINSTVPTDPEHRTALMLAESQGHQGIVKFLLARGARANATLPPVFDPEALENNKSIAFNIGKIAEFKGLQKLSDNLFNSPNATGSIIEGDIHHESIAKFWYSFFVAKRGQISRLPLKASPPDTRRPMEGDEKSVETLVRYFFSMLPLSEQQKDCRIIEVKLAQHIAPYRGGYKKDPSKSGLIPHMDTSGGFLATVLIDNTFQYGGDFTLFNLDYIVYSMYNQGQGIVSHFPKLPSRFNFATYPGRPGQGYMIDERLGPLPLIAHGNTSFWNTDESPAHRTVLIFRFFRPESDENVPLN